MSVFVKDKSFYKRVLAIGLPVSGQQLITVGINLMDNIMVGQLNETALSAGTLAVQVHTTFGFMVMGMGMGSSVLISRFWGAGDRENLKRSIVLMYRFCLCIALVFMLLVAFFRRR